MTRAERRRKERRSKKARNISRTKIFLGGIAILPLFVLIAVLLIIPSGRGGDFVTTVFDNPKDTLNYLITTHPKEAISKELSQFIDSGEVVIIFDHPSLAPDSFGVFALVLEEYLEGREPIRERTLVPVFGFSTNIIQAKRPDIAKQVILYHEYTHFRSWKEDKYPGHSYVGREVFDTAEQVELHYEEEIYAHLEGCKFAIEFGAASWFNDCTVLRDRGSRTYREYLARNFVEEGRFPEKFLPLLLELASK